MHRTASPSRTTSLGIALAGLLIAVGGTGLHAADSVTIVSDRDNTLIESPLSNVSGGSAYHFYVGRVGQNDNGTVRRGLLRFDIAGAVPKGATITSVSLTLHCAQAGGGGQQPISLHRLLADWGEEDSFGFGGGGTFAEPGDATWLHTFFPTEFWETPGGDFDATVSITRLVGGTGFYTWSSTDQAVADVQSWLDDPAANFGWLLLGNEAVLQTVRKFDTRESPAPANWPRLTIGFEPAVENPADLNGDGVVDGADLGILLSNWGTPGPGDLDGNGVVDGADLGALLKAWT